MILFYFKFTYIAKFCDQIECKILKLSRIYRKNFNNLRFMIKIYAQCLIDKKSKKYLDKSFLLILM